MDGGALITATVYTRDGDSWGYELHAGELAGDRTYWESVAAMPRRHQIAAIRQLHASNPMAQYKTAQQVIRILIKDDMDE